MTKTTGEQEDYLTRSCTRGCDAVAFCRLGSLVRFLDYPQRLRDVIKALFEYSAWQPMKAFAANLSDSRTYTPNCPSRIPALLLPLLERAYPDVIWQSVFGVSWIFDGGLHEICVSLSYQTTDPHIYVGVTRFGDNNWRLHCLSSRDFGSESYVATVAISSSKSDMQRLLLELFLRRAIRDDLSTETFTQINGPVGSKDPFGWEGRTSPKFARQLVEVGVLGRALGLPHVDTHAEYKEFQERFPLIFATQT